MNSLFMTSFIIDGSIHGVSFRNVKYECLVDVFKLQQTEFFGFYRSVVLISVAYLQE